MHLKNQNFISPNILNNRSSLGIRKKKGNEQKIGFKAECNEQEHQTGGEQTSVVSKHKGEINHKAREILQTLEESGLHPEATKEPQKNFQEEKAWTRFWI